MTARARGGGPRRTDTGGDARVRQSDRDRFDRGVQGATRPQPSGLMHAITRTASQRVLKPKQSVTNNPEPHPSKKKKKSTKAAAAQRQTHPLAPTWR